MAFTFELLNNLKLEKTEWVMIKYKGIDEYRSGQIATNQLWDADNKIIFDDTHTGIYIHFVRQAYPSMLEIEKIEYFYRVKNHPWYVIQYGQIQFSFGKFDSLKQTNYTILKTNGDLIKIGFIENKLEPLDADRLDFFLYYVDNTNIQRKLSYFEIVDVF